MTTAGSIWWWLTIRFRNILYRNKHDGTFEDISYLSGFALSDDGREQAAMGIAVGDYNRDGKVDFSYHEFLGRLQHALPQ